MALTGRPKRGFPAAAPKRQQLAKEQDRGTKREDPETGKKFYDLNKDPIVSPYTGKSYPRSFFEQNAPATARKAGSETKEEEEEEEVETEEAAETSGPEIVSLEDADAEESSGDDDDDEDIPEIEDSEDVEDIGDDEEDVFLEEDEDEDENLDFDVGGDDER